MQIVSLGDNMHGMSKPVFREKYFKILSAEIFTQHAEYQLKKYRHSLQYS